VFTAVEDVQTEGNMRTSAVFIVAAFSVFFFGFGMILVAQGPGGPRGQMQQGGGGGQQPPWVQNAQTAAPARGAQLAAQGNQQARPVAQPAAQGNQQARPAALNPNQVTQIIARLRAMDTNQNGVLEANEIPANQRDRVNTMITQLGGNPSSASFNLANLERRAMAAAGGAQPSQQQQQQADNARQQQQRQQQPAPLVPAFGEQVTAGAPPLGFGQRAPVAQTAPQAAQQRGTANQQSIVPPVIARTSTPYDHIPAALRNNANIGWFFEFDTDQDGQLTMQEYVNGLGGGWTGSRAREFTGGWLTLIDGEITWVDASVEGGVWINGLDRNGDGFATLDEVLLTVQERTEVEARLHARAGTTARAGQQVQQQIRQPAMAAPATTPPANVRPQPGNAAANQGNAPVRMQGNPQMGPGGGRGAANQPPARGGRGGG